MSKGTVRLFLEVSGGGGLTLMESLAIADVCLVDERSGCRWFGDLWRVTEQETSPHGVYRVLSVDIRSVTCTDCEQRVVLTRGLDDGSQAMADKRVVKGCKHGTATYS